MSDDRGGPPSEVSLPCGKVRLLDYLKHPDHGECRLLDYREEDGTVTLKDDRGRRHERVPADELSIPYAEARGGLLARWCKTPLCLTLRKSHLQNHLLCFLINWQWTAGRKRTWFYCRNRTIVRRGFIAPKSLGKLFKGLTDAGFIATRKGRRDGRREIRINYKRINRELARLREAWEAKADEWVDEERRKLRAWKARR